jgi:hypothetical protein
MLKKRKEKKENNLDRVWHPCLTQGSSLLGWSPFLRSNWSLEMLDFAEGGKLKKPEQKSSKQAKGPTTN